MPGTSRRCSPNGRPRCRTGCGWRSAAGPDRDWLKVTYGEAKKQVDSVTQALLDRGFGPDRPVMILSSNSIEFALLTMAAMQARAPVAPVSPAYSVMSQDHAKLKYVFDLIKPGLVFVQNGEIYARALAALDLEGVLLVHVDKPPPKMQSLPWTRAGGDQGDRRGGEVRRRRSSRRRLASSCSPRAAPACPRPSSTRRR